MIIFRSDAFSCSFLLYVRLTTPVSCRMGRSYQTYLRANSFHTQNTRHKESSSDFPKEEDYLYSSKRKSLKFNHCVKSESKKILIACQKADDPLLAQRLIAQLLGDYFSTQNHTDAFKLFLEPHCKAAFEGRKGSILCLFLMLFMFDHNRCINVMTLYQHILLNPGPDANILNLADAIYVASLLKAEKQLINKSPPVSLLSKFYLALHFIKTHDVSAGLKVMQDVNTQKHKTTYLNIMIQLNASASDFPNVVSLLWHAAYHKIHLGLDTWIMLQDLRVEGTRHRQLSRHISWTKSRGLLQNIMIEDSLQRFVRKEVIREYRKHFKSRFNVKL